MDRKKGVSLIVLVVTIIVLAILVTVSITVGLKNMNKGRKNAFENELQQLEELCIAADELNKLDEYVSKEFLTLSEFKSKAPSLTEMNNETSKNRENSQSKFSKINIDKIGANEISRGKGQKGDKDYFYISRKTGRVYYLNGVKDKKVTYYSLAGVSNIQKDPIDLDATGPVSPGSINELQGNLFVEEYKDNKIYIKFVKDFNKNYSAERITTDTNGKRKVLEIGSNIINNEYVIDASMAKNITKMEIKIYVSSFSSVVQPVTLLEKLDTEPPTISNINIEKKTTLNILNVTAQDNKNQIEGYYILPTDKKDEYGNSKKVFYTNIQDSKLLANEIKLKGKFSKENIIKVDKDITKLYLIAIDKNGNFSDVKEVVI